MLVLGSGCLTNGLARLIRKLGLPSGPNVKSEHTRFAYQAFIITGLLVFIAFPTTLIVDDAIVLHTIAYENSVVDNLSAAKSKSRRIVAEDLVNVKTPLGPLDCTAKKGAAREQRCLLQERTYATEDNYNKLLATRKQWGAYHDCVNLQSNQQTKEDEENNANGQKEENGKQLQSKNCDIKPAPWSFTVGVANQLARYSNKPEVARVLTVFANAQADRPAAPLLSGIEWSRWSVGGLLALLGSLCFLVGSVAKHVLGIELTDRLALDEESEFKPVDGSQWLLLRPTTSLPTLDQPATYIDLRDATLTPKFTSPDKGTILVLRHVESRIENVEWREALLFLLRSPTAGCIVLDSEIDPLHFLLSRVRETENALGQDAGTQKELQTSYRALQEELASWSMALRWVRKIRYILPAPPPIHATTNAVRLARECSCTEPLMEIGKRIGKPENNIEDYRWEEVVGFVLDAAEPYYRSVWALCSHEERLVLIQLAQEGLVNPKQIEIVKRLARRRLVNVDPRFCIMNDSFRCFVRTVESHDYVSDLERAPANSAWARLGTPLYALAAVVIAILLFTAQDMFTSIIAVVTGVAGTLSSMRNIYASTIQPVVGIAKNA
jgi:hypothetical protein